MLEYISIDTGDEHRVAIRHDRIPDRSLFIGLSDHPGRRSSRRPPDLMIELMTDNAAFKRVTCRRSALSPPLVPKQVLATFEGIVSIPMIDGILAGSLDANFTGLTDAISTMRKFFDVAFDIDTDKDHPIHKLTTSPPFGKLSADRTSKFEMLLYEAREKLAWQAGETEREAARERIAAKRAAYHAKVAENQALVNAGWGDW